MDDKKPFTPSARAVADVYAGALVLAEGGTEETYIAEFRRMLEVERAKAWEAGAQTGYEHGRKDEKYSLAYAVPTNTPHE